MLLNKLAVQCVQVSVQWNVTFLKTCFSANPSLWPYPGESLNWKTYRIPLYWNITNIFSFKPYLMTLTRLRRRKSDLPLRTYMYDGQWCETGRDFDRTGRDGTKRDGTGRSKIVRTKTRQRAKWLIYSLFLIVAFMVPSRPERPERISRDGTGRAISSRFTSLMTYSVKSLACIICVYELREVEETLHVQ